MHRNGPARWSMYSGWTQRALSNTTRHVSVSRIHAVCGSHTNVDRRNELARHAHGQSNGIATRNHMSESLLYSITMWRCGERVLSVDAVVPRWESGHPAQDDRVLSSLMSARSLSANRAQRLGPNARTACPLHTYGSYTLMTDLAHGQKFVDRAHVTLASLCITPRCGRCAM